MGGVPSNLVLPHPYHCCQAYLESDEETIKEHCSPEMIERLTGIMHVQKAQVRRAGAGWGSGASGGRGGAGWVRRR